MPSERTVTDYVICEPGILDLHQQPLDAQLLKDQQARHEALRLSFPQGVEEVKIGNKRAWRSAGLSNSAALKKKLQDETELGETLTRELEAQDLFSELQSEANRGLSEAQTRVRYDLAKIALEKKQKAPENQASDAQMQGMAGENDSNSYDDEDDEQDADSLDEQICDEYEVNEMEVDCYDNGGNMFASDFPTT